MGTSYANFGLTIDELTGEQLEWLEAELETPFHENPNREEFYWDFDREITDDSVILSAPEAGSVDDAILFCQNFLEKFQLERTIYFSWSMTLVGGKYESVQGGGAAVITRRGTKKFTTQEWLENEGRQQ